jgi:PAS domain-containing protein
MKKWPPPLPASRSSGPAPAFSALSPLAIVLDGKGRVRKVNSAFRGWCGLDVPPTGSRTWDRVLPPDACAAIDDALRDHHGGARTSSDRIWTAGNDGAHARWWILALAPRGGSFGLISITGVPAREASGPGPNQVTPLANGTLATWVFDRATLQFMGVNDLAAAWHGCSTSELGAMRLHDVLDWEETVRLVETLSDLEPDRAVRSTWMHRRKDGGVVHVDAELTATEERGRSACVVTAEKWAAPPA